MKFNKCIQFESIEYFQSYSELDYRLWSRWCSDLVGYWNSKPNPFFLVFNVKIMACNPNFLLSGSIQKRLNKKYGKYTVILGPELASQSKV